MGKGVLTLAPALVVAAVAPGIAGAKPKPKHKAKAQPVALSVESSRADMVSGGDAQARSKRG
jgi:3-deoxy-D-arabino-heptulosonate 7-phosphate (DAHP) synthase class II